MKFRLAAETFHVSFVKSLSHIRRRRRAAGKRSPADGRRTDEVAAQTYDDRRRRRQRPRRRKLRDNIFNISKYWSGNAAEFSGTKNRSMRVRMEEKRDWEGVREGTTYSTFC